MEITVFPEPIMLVELWCRMLDHDKESEPYLEKTEMRMSHWIEGNSLKDNKIYIGSAGIRQRRKVKLIKRRERGDMMRAMLEMDKPGRDPEAEARSHGWTPPRVTRDNRRFYNNRMVWSTVVATTRRRMYNTRRSVRPVHCSITSTAGSYWRLLGDIMFRERFLVRQHHIQMV